MHVSGTLTFTVHGKFLQDFRAVGSSFYSEQKFFFNVIVRTLVLSSLFSLDAERRMAVSFCFTQKMR